MLRAIVLIALAIAGSGCGGRGDDDKRGSADAQRHRITARAERRDAAPIAKPSRADCEGLQAQRVELETDPSMKDVIRSASQTNLDECLRELNKEQVACAALARSGAEFGDCFVKHR